MPGFVVDPHTLVRNSGRQVDFAAWAATHTNAQTGKVEIPAGTIVDEDVDGKLIPSADDAASGILATDAIEGDRSAAKTGYGVLVGGVLYSNLLPAAPTAGQIANLNAAGTGFTFEVYEDDRSA